PSRPCASTATRPTRSLVHRPYAEPSRTPAIDSRRSLGDAIFSTARGRFLWRKWPPLWTIGTRLWTTRRCTEIAGISLAEPLAQVARQGIELSYQPAACGGKER